MSGRLDEAPVLGRPNQKALSYQTLQERVEGSENYLVIKNVTISKFSKSRLRQPGNTVDNVFKAKGKLPRGRLTAIITASDFDESASSLLRFASGQLFGDQDYVLEGHVEDTSNRLWAACDWQAKVAIISQVRQPPDQVTVREILKTSCALAGTSTESINHVAQLCEITSLLKKLDSELTGIQRKLVHIAEKLLSKPPGGIELLVLENACGGGADLIRVLKRLCEEGVTVFCSLTRPSSRVYHTLDNIVIMHESRVIYFGPGQEAMDYFGSIDSSYKCPETSNPAEFFVDILQARGASTMAEHWVQRHAMEKPRDAYVKPDDPCEPPNKFTFPFLPLLSREIHKWSRDSFTGYGAILQTLCTALLVGVLAWHLDYDQTDLKAREAVCVLIVLDSGVRAVFSTIQETHVDKNLAFPLFCATTIMTIGRAFLLSLCVVLYKYMVGLHASYGDLVNVVFALILSCSFLACAVNQVFSYNVAIRVLVPLTVVFCVLSPYWVHVGDPLFLLDWLRFLSPFYLAYDSIMGVEFKNLNFFCTDEQLEQDRGECPFRSGDAYLDWRGVEDSVNPQGALYLQASGYLFLSFLLLLVRKTARTSGQKSSYCGFRWPMS